MTEATQRVAKYNLTNRLPEVLLAIAYHAEANRSDPFAGARAACHFRNGIADLGDKTYSSERRLKQELVDDIDHEVYRTVVIHTNQKRP